MSGYSYRTLGSFESEAEVDDYARKNQIDVRDIKTRRGLGGTIEAAVREEAYNASKSDIFGGYSRGSGFQ